MNRTQANLLLILAGAIWGMGFVAQSTAMDSIGPFLFIGLRFAAATLAVLPLAVLESRRAPVAMSRPQWNAFMLIGLMLFGGIAFQQIGILTTTVTNSGFLTGLYVVMTPICGVLLFRHWPHIAVWTASFIAMAGIWLLAGGSLSALNQGDWFTMLAALFCAFQLVLIGRHAAQTGRPVTMAVTEFAICAVLGLSLAVLFEPISLAAIKQAAPQILYSGIFSGGIAFTLQAIGQRYTTSAQAAIFLSSEAVFAALFGALLLGERLPLIGWAGCAFIFVAILIAEAVPALARKPAVANP
ncbi:MAG: DMT family transporter [Rhizobiaceae bacterium]|nr:DMT family transporter [Rhizobiaceae bacterium]